MGSAEILAAMNRIPVGKGFPLSDPRSAITALEHQLGAFKLWCVDWEGVPAGIVGFAAARSAPRDEVLISGYRSARRMLADPTGPQALAVRP